MQCATRCGAARLKDTLLSSVTDFAGDFVFTIAESRVCLLAVLDGKMSRLIALVVVRFSKNEKWWEIIGSGRKW